MCGVFRDDLGNRCGGRRQQCLLLLFLVVRASISSKGGCEWRWCPRDDLNNVKVKKAAGRVEILGLASRVMAKKSQGLCSLDLCVVTLDKYFLSLGLCSCVMQEPDENQGPCPGDRGQQSAHMGLQMGQGTFCLIQPQAEALPVVLLLTFPQTSNLRRHLRWWRQNDSRWSLRFLYALLCQYSNSSQHVYPQLLTWGILIWSLLSHNDLENRILEIHELGWNRKKNPIFILTNFSLKCNISLPMNQGNKPQSYEQDLPVHHQWKSQVFSCYSAGSQFSCPYLVPPSQIWAGLVTHCKQQNVAEMSLCQSWA